MPFCYLLLTAVIIASTSHADAAPIGSWMTIYESSSNPYDERSTLEKILMNATFNSTDNFHIIKKAFQPRPGTHKICIPITFNITYSDQPECYDTDNYTSGFYTKSVLWTEFDTADFAGKVLLYFALSDLNVFGFDWAGACDLDIDNYGMVNDSAQIINLVVPSLSCNDTNLESEIHLSLLYLTTLVRELIIIMHVLHRYTLCGGRRVSWDEIKQPTLY